MIQKEYTINNRVYRLVEEEKRWELDRNHFVMVGNVRHNFDTMSRAIDFAQKYKLKYECDFSKEEENKPERLEGFVNRKHYFKYGEAVIFKRMTDDTRMIEIKENEIIVSRDDVIEAFKRTNSFSNNYKEEFMKELGFK